LSTHANAASENFSAVLSGFEEVGALPSAKTNPMPPPDETFTFPTGAIFSTGTGTIQLNLDKDKKSISYTLTYSSFSSSTSIQQAHIHFGKRHVPGGIMVFFCTNLGNGPTTATPPPACPNAGTVTGTWTAANVVGPASQGITAQNFDALVAALESDTAYGNIHTAAFTSGEIRGQIRRNQGNQGNQ
jgi:hypothetical protein